MAEDWTVHEVSGKWADAAGQSIAIDFQALRYRDGMVTWAYADVLGNMFSGRKTCQAWAESQKEREPLTAFADLCGVSYGEHFVPSRRQVRAGRAMSAYTRDSQQLTTQLLLCQLLCWSCSSWKHVMKAKARTMLKLFLSGTVQLSLISSQMVEHMWSDAVSFCDSSMGQTACGHFDGASFSMGEASVGMTPVERLVAHLALVGPIAGASRACKHVVSVCVRRLAEAINGPLATMCPAKPPHKARSRTGGSKQGSRVTDTFRRPRCGLLAVSAWGDKARAQPARKGSPRQLFTAGCARTCARTGWHVGGRSSPEARSPSMKTHLAWAIRPRSAS